MLHSYGEVAERPNAGALKASEGKTSGGSNPSLAAHRHTFLWSSHEKLFGASPFDLLQALS